MVFAICDQRRALPALDPDSSRSRRPPIPGGEPLGVAHQASAIRFQADGGSRASPPTEAFDGNGYRYGRGAGRIFG